MATYRAAKWILANGVPFTRITIFLDSQAAIKPLSNVANNSRIVRECCRGTNLLPRKFTVTLIWVPGHCDIPGNCRAHFFRKPLQSTSFKLTIARKFFRDANLSWISEEFCSNAGLTWPLMDRRRTKQLLGLGRNIISIIVMPCLPVTVLWVDTRKECVTSAVDTDPLRKRRQLSTFSTNVYLMGGADIRYLALPLLPA